MTACVVPSPSVYLLCYGCVCYSSIGCRVVCVVVLLCRLCCLLVDRAFEPAREIVVRLTISVVGSSHHGRDAKRNLFPRILVDFVVP
jgi:hypothetical protein